MKQLITLIIILSSTIHCGFTQCTSVKVNNMSMEIHEVTLRQFDEFVSQTAYVTSAEKADSSFAMVISRYKMVQGISWRNDFYGNIIKRENYDSLPVTNVSAKDAMAYCKWRGKRLPTAEEWLLFAKGGEDFRYSGSNNLNQVGWYERNSNDRIKKIMQKQPNQYGIYDMTGNVMEIVKGDNNDWFHRGGGFFSDRSTMKIDDPGYKKNSTNRFPTVGFRCLCED